ncbi:MAG: hypothetical protein RIR70_1904 [Pseudomonadota bacterium]
MLKVLDRLEEWLIALLMGAATVVIFAAVTHRFLAGATAASIFGQDFQTAVIAINMSWAQELCIIMFVWMAKFGAAYGVRTGIHVGVDVIINQLAPHNRRKFVLFGLFSGALFTGVVCALGGRLVWENGMHHAVFQFLSLPLDGTPEGPITPDLEWPTWVVYSAVPLGSALMCFRFLQVAVNFIRTGELPHHDHGHVDGMEEELGQTPAKN